MSLEGTGGNRGAVNCKIGYRPKNQILEFRCIEITYGWIDSLTLNSTLYIIRAHCNPCLADSALTACQGWLKMQKTMQQDQLDSDSKNLGQQSDMQTEQTEADLSGLELQNRVSRQQALRFILTQLLATIALSAILLIFDFVIAYSSLAGGLIATLANAWFAIKVFRVKPTVAAETLLATFYVGEIYKFVFTGAMFVIAFIMIKPLSAVALLVTYFLIHMTPAVQNAFGRNDQSVSMSREKK